MDKPSKLIAMVLVTLLATVVLATLALAFPNARDPLFIGFTLGCWGFAARAYRTKHRNA